jgi:hypothetical protein
MHGTIPARIPFLISMTLATSSSPAAPERLRLAAVSAGVVALAPRFATAATYLAAWIVPQRIPPGLVNGLFIGMVLEFLLIHSYAFLNILGGAASGAKPVEKLRGALVVLGFGAFYLLMASVIGWATHSMTPVWTIVWLLGSRIFEVVVAGEPTSAVAQSRTASWMRHVWLYLTLAVLTAVVPLPRLGLTEEIVAGFALPGTGTWVEKPQSVLAFGFLYFGLGAFFDLRARLRR